MPRGKPRATSFVGHWLGRAAALGLVLFAGPAGTAPYPLARPGPPVEEEEETWVLRVGIRLEGDAATATPPALTTLDRCLALESDHAAPATVGVTIDFEGQVHAGWVADGWTVDGAPFQRVQFCLGLDEAFDRIRVSVRGRPAFDWEVGRTLCLTRGVRGRIWEDGRAGFLGSGPPGSLAVSTAFWCQAGDGSVFQTEFERSPTPPRSRTLPPAGLTATCGSRGAIWSHETKIHSTGMAELFFASCGFDSASRGPLVIRQDGEEIARYEEADFAWVPSWNWDPPGRDGAPPEPPETRPPSGEDGPGLKVIVRTTPSGDREVGRPTLLTGDRCRRTVDRLGARVDEPASRAVRFRTDGPSPWFTTRALEGGDGSAPWTVGCFPLSASSTRWTVQIGGVDVQSWVRSENLCLSRAARVRENVVYRTEGLTSPHRLEGAPVWTSKLGVGFGLPCLSSTGELLKPDPHLEDGPISYGVEPPTGLAATCGDAPAAWSSFVQPASGQYIQFFIASCGFDKASRGPLVIRQEGEEIARYEESEFDWVPSWNWDPPSSQDVGE